MMIWLLLLMLATGCAARAQQTFHELTIIPDTTATPAVGELRFRESTGWLADTATEYVGFKAPASLSASTVWQLPAADGTPNQSLCTDGNKVLSWCTGGGGGGDVFTTAANTFVTGPQSIVLLGSEVRGRATSTWLTTCRLAKRIQRGGGITFTKSTHGSSRHRPDIGCESCATG